MTSKDLASAGGLDSGLALDILTGKVDAHKAVFSEPDPTETARRIAERDAAAGSIDELLGGNTVSGKEYVNRPFKLTAVDWNRSDFESEAGLPFFAVLYGVEPSGKSVTVTVGAASVMRKVAKMAVEGWLPHWVKIIERPATDKGYKPLDIADATEFAPFDAA